MRSFFQKGSWTIVDQALFAGSNFVLNILLAEALPADEYGAFAVAFAVFLFIGTLHTGLFTEPMLVFGAGRFKERLGAYLAILRKAHVLFALGSCLLLALIALAVYRFGATDIAHTLLVLAFAQPFILFLWLMRRACYTILSPSTSALGGIIYMVILLSAAAAMRITGTLTVTAALILMSIGSLVGGLVIVIRLRRVDDTESLDASEVVAEHKKYSGWATATGVLGWLPGGIPYIILPLIAGAAAPGILRALVNFIMPAVQAYAALSILLVPMFVKARESGRFRKSVAATAGLLVAANGTYWILLGFFGGTLIDLLYGGKYIEYAGYLWIAGAYPFISGLAVVVRTALRSLELPNYVFWASVASAIAAGTVSLFLIIAYGVKGALIGISLNMAVELAMMTYYFRTSARVARKAST